MEHPDLERLPVSALAQCLLLGQRPGPRVIACRGSEYSQELLPLLVELGPRCRLRPLVAPPHRCGRSAHLRPTCRPGLWLAPSNAQTTRTAPCQPPLSPFTPKTHHRSPSPRPHS